MVNRTLLTKFTKPSKSSTPRVSVLNKRFARKPREKRYLHLLKWSKN